MNTINGMHVVVSTLAPEFVPVLQMAPCGCSEKVLAEFNAWLLERFGMRRHVLIMGGQIVMHPNTYAFFRKEMALGQESHSNGSSNA